MYPTRIFNNEIKWISFHPQSAVFLSYLTRRKQNAWTNDAVSDVSTSQLGVS